MPAWLGKPASARIVKMMLSTVPTSTTNITGFFHWMSGRSMTNDCFRAVFSKSGANRPLRRLSLRATLASSPGCGTCTGGRERVDVSIFNSLRELSSKCFLRTWHRGSASERQRTKMLCHGAQHGGGQEQQGANEQDRPQQ